jgi:hypothetical protein
LPELRDNLTSANIWRRYFHPEFFCMFNRIIPTLIPLSLSHFGLSPVGSCGQKVERVTLLNWIMNLPNVPFNFFKASSNVRKIRFHRFLSGVFRGKFSHF